MSLFGHCPQFDTECVCSVVMQFPVWTTVILFGFSIIYYDVMYFWLGLELMANYVLNIILNLYVHPHDATRVVFGTAGFLGYPSFQAQFISNLATVTLLFYHLHRVHIPGWIFVCFYTIIIAVMFAAVYLAKESYGSIYVGTVVGWALGVVASLVFTNFLYRYSDALCHSWFGNLYGLRNSYAIRYQLENKSTHDKMELLLDAGQFKNRKEIINFVMAFNGIADKQSSDAIYVRAEQLELRV